MAASELKTITTLRPSPPSVSPTPKPCTLMTHGADHPVEVRRTRSPLPPAPLITRPACVSSTMATPRASRNDGPSTGRADDCTLESVPMVSVMRSCIDVSPQPATNPRQGSVSAMAGTTERVTWWRESVRM